MRRLAGGASTRSQKNSYSSLNSCIIITKHTRDLEANKMANIKTYSGKELLDPANSALFEEIVLMISLAFHDDPSTKWIFDGCTPSEYATLRPHYFRFLTKMALRVGGMVTVITGDNPKSATTETTTTTTTTQTQKDTQVPAASKIRAAGVLIPSSSNEAFESTWNVICSGFLALPFTVGLRSTLKISMGIGGPLRKMQARVLPEAEERHSYWHLLILATHPDSQGQGLGKKMLLEFQDVVGHAEVGKKNKGGLYLEAGSLGARRLYARTGFVDRDTMTFGDCVRQGGDIIKQSDGRVTGGRMWAMTWNA